MASQLYELASRLRILPGGGADDAQSRHLRQLLRGNDLSSSAIRSEKQLLLEIVVQHHLSRPSQREQIRRLPLYPTDKLNLQFSSNYKRGRDAPQTTIHCVVSDCNHCM